MEKNKKRKIYIIVMSVLLVLTFVATSTFTLSFFGASGSSTSTITLGNAVTVDSSVTVSTANLYVLPSQNVVVNANATVKSEGSSTPTPALLRARIDVFTTAPSVKHTIDDSVTLDGVKAYWVKSTDGYFYLMSSNSTTGTLTTIQPGSTGKVVPFNINVKIPDTLTNADNGKSYKISVTFCAIQGIIYASDGVKTITNSINNTKDIFNNVEGTSGQGEEKFVTKYEIQGNTQFSTSPSPNSPATLTSVGEGGGKNLLDMKKMTTYNSVSGITCKYLPEEDCFVLDGKPTTTVMLKTGWLNIPADKTAKYSISTRYVSGTIDRSTSSSTAKYAVAYFGNSDTINSYGNWQNVNLQLYDTALNNVSCDKNYISLFWFYINDGITFNNYKVRVQIEKNSTATSYEGYNSINIDYSGSDATNLVVNGDGRLNNNTNFTSFDYYEDSTSPSGSKYTKKTTDYSVPTTNLIEVDTNSAYDYSASFYVDGSVSGHNFYCGIMEFDVDKKLINPNYFMHYKDSTTYLTQDLKNGDTVVHLNNVGGFTVNSSTTIYRLGLIFWNYKDSTGYQYPIGTYSRNAWIDLYTYDAVDTTNNTITLKSPWALGTMASGTYLSQSNSGASYNYCLLSGNTAHKYVGTWFSESTTISGVNTTASDSNTRAFRPGTKYVKPFIMDGRNCEFSWTNVSFKRVAETYNINLAGHEPLRRISDTVYDSIDSSTGKLTRKVGVYTFTGNETWKYEANSGLGLYWTPITGRKASTDCAMISSHFKYYVSTVSAPEYGGFRSGGQTNTMFVFNVKNDINAWKEFLKAQASAGTPVTLYYELATPVVETISCPKLRISTIGINEYNATSSCAYPILKVTE